MTTELIKYFTDQIKDQLATLDSLLAERSNTIKNCILNNPSAIQSVIMKTCQNRVDSSIQSFFIKTLSNIQMKYSYSNIRYENIFPTKNRLNGSDPATKTRLFQGMKYQAIANWKEMTDLSDTDKAKLIAFYGLKMYANINISMTYNDPAKIYPDYNPIDSKFISGSALMIVEELSNDNYTVYDLNNQPKELKQNFEYMREKKYTKEQLIEMINSFNDVPTLNELYNKFFKTILENAKSTEDLEKYMSKELLRKYLKTFELTDMLKAERKSKQK